MKKRIGMDNELVSAIEKLMANAYRKDIGLKIKPKANKMLATDIQK